MENDGSCDLFMHDGPCRLYGWIRSVDTAVVHHGCFTYVAVCCVLYNTIEARGVWREVNMPHLYVIKIHKDRDINPETDPLLSKSPLKRPLWI